MLLAVRLVNLSSADGKRSGHEVILPVTRHALPRRDLIAHTIPTVLAIGKILQPSTMGRRGIEVGNSKKSARDGFSAATKRLLEHRVNGRCSKPDCRRPTRGPASTPIRTVNIGDAAHITAAAVGGARYDNSLTTEQRRAPENGIWLCKPCAKLVDDDEDRFPTSLLREWKRQAEDTARMECETPFRMAAPINVIPTTHRQSSRILSFDHEFSTTINLGDEDAEVRVLNLVAMLREFMIFAVYRTCLESGIEDFVFLTTLQVKEQPNDPLVHFHLVVSSHITYFVAEFQRIYEAVLNGSNDRRIFAPGVPTNLRCQSMIRMGELISLRASRIGPAHLDISLTEQISSLREPFSTSSLLSLLSQIKNTKFIMIPEYSAAPHEERIMRYLAEINDTGRFSLDDIAIDQTNPEKFRIVRIGE